jgi:hypothetical protein
LNRLRGRRHGSGGRDRRRRPRPAPARSPAGGMSRASVPSRSRNGFCDAVCRSPRTSNVECVVAARIIDSSSRRRAGP